MTHRMCFVIVFLAFAMCEGKLPSSIKVCSRNDPNVAKCIIESVKKLQPNLASGILAPDFRIPPLEPLKLDNLHIDRGPNFQVHISNLVVQKGASNFIIDKLKVNLNDLTFDYLITFPRLEWNGKYNLKLKIALVPVAGKGDIFGWAENYKGRVRMQGQKFKGQNGKTYIKFNQLQIRIVPGRSKIELKNLFDTNPALKLVGNAFVDENTGTFLQDITPGLEKNLESTFLSASNLIVKDASFDELFPNI